ncbi:MAG: sugar-binding protein [Victivallaceae bacterium]|nr:sugar-binding protein [Victivallaceae bacterium]
MFYRTLIASKMEIIALLLTLSGIFTIGAGMEKGAGIYFPMNEGGGEFTFDRNGRKGIIHDAKWGKGKFGSGLYFNGRDSYVEVADIKDFNSADELTVAVWINPHGSGKQRNKPVILSQGKYKKGGWYLFFNSPGGIGIVLSNPDKVYIISTRDGIRTNQWQHVAITMDKKKGAVIYINGEKILIKKEGFEWLPSLLPLYIGKYRDKNFEYEGAIDELRIYNRVLTAAEVKTLISHPAGEADSRENIPVVSRVKMPPCVDGEIKNDVWNTVPVTAFDFKLTGGNNKKAGKQSFVSTVYDDRNIYFYFYLLEPDIAKISANYLQRDSSVWEDDCIEIFLDVNNDKKSYYHFICNSKGVQADEYNPGRQGKNLAWNGKWQSAAKTGKNFWCAEIAIPFKTLRLNEAPVRGTCWGVSLNRCETQTKEFSGWPDGSFHNPKKFGNIIFGNTVIAGSGGTPFKDNILEKLAEIKEKTAVSRRSLAVLKNVSGLADVRSALSEIAGQRLAIANDLAKLKKDKDIIASEWSQIDNKLVQMKMRLNVSEIKLEITGLYDKIREKVPLVAGAKGNVSQTLLKIAAKAESAKMSAADEKYYTRIKHKIYRLFYKQPYLIWMKSPWKNLAPDQLPPVTAESLKKINMSMAINETRSGSFVITNFSDKGLSFIVTGQNGQIPLIIRECYPIKAVNGKLVNDAMPLLETLKVPPFQSREVWLTADSRNLRPGNYETALSIKADKLADTVKLNVRVYPVTLPECDKNFPFYTYVWDYLDTKSPEIQEAAVKDLRTHYITVPYFNTGAVPWPEFDSDGKMKEIDFSGCDRAIKLWEKGSYKMLAWYWHFRVSLSRSKNCNAKRFGEKFMSSEWKANFSAWLSKFVAHLKEKGLTYDDFYFHIFDETTSDELQKTAQLIKQIDPGIKIFLDPCVISFRITDRIKNLLSYIDIWSPYLWRFLERKEDLKIMSGKGKYYWNYANPVGIPQYFSKYRLIPWYTYKLGMHGCGYWAYLCYEKRSWDQTKQQSWDMVYLSRYAPADVSRKELLIPSKRWEAWREGVEDYLYLYILEKTIRDAEAKGIALKTVKSARALIAEEVKKATGEDACPELAEKARLKLLGKIVELKNETRKK